MASFDDTDRTIALGGVFQAARMARDMARSGSCDARAFAASREALFDFEPDTVASIFGGVEGVALGLHGLHQQLERPLARDLDVSRYVVSLLHLADRLVRSDAGMQKLHSDLIALARRREHFELTDSVQNEQLARIYQDHISPLGPRIMISGDPLHLQNPDNAARIRVALLAGIRAAVLWRQAGGKKWHLLIRRRTFASKTRELIDILTP